MQRDIKKLFWLACLGSFGMIALILFGVLLMAFGLDNFAFFFSFHLPVSILPLTVLFWYVNVRASSLFDTLIKNKFAKKWFTFALSQLLILVLILALAVVGARSRVFEIIATLAGFAYCLVAIAQAIFLARGVRESVDLGIEMRRLLRVCALFAACHTLFMVMFTVSMLWSHAL